MSAEPIRIPVPVETQSVVFEAANRGYDRRQVDQHVHRLEQELAELRWELEARQGEQDGIRDGWAGLRAAEADFRRVRAAWRPSYAEFSNRLERVLALAEEQAGDIVETARRDATLVRAGAEAEAAALRKDIAAQAAQLRKAAADDQDAVRERGRQQRAALDRELAERRRDAELAVKGLLAKVRVQADDMLVTARRDAAEIESRARDRVAGLRRQHTDVAAEVVALRDRLIALVESMPAPPTTGRTVS